MSPHLYTTFAGVILCLGFALLAIGATFDIFFRRRMVRAGYKWVFLAGGTFDYGRYHEARREHGWAAWPVYLMWAIYILGIAALIAGCFGYFGTTLGQ